MQFVKNGPQVPERLLQAHEEGRVVFFCGAGISYPAGLPGFGGLVEQMYTHVGETPNAVEAAAIKNQQLDTAIGLLEGRLVGGRSETRKALNNILCPDLTRLNATRTHEALLTLSKSREDQYRLVTTNFDRIFQTIVERESLKVPSFEAPLLPVPKNRWAGLVYLHGLLPQVPTEDQLNRLVVSSGDFGLAYLIERWAARFVSELFRGFKVCFVGYSINDPVLRYMMDALAADRLMGEEQIEAFAFGSYSKGKKELVEQEWAAKNVTPILYKEFRRHYYLHSTLHEWATTYRDGIGGKSQIVSQHAYSKPEDSTEQDNFVQKMLWALCDPSGVPAKHFANFEPVPPLDWLDPLSEELFKHQDLSRFQIRPNPNVDEKLKFSVMSRPAPYTLAPRMSVVSWGYAHSNWDEVMNNLAEWLAKHLHDPKLYLWAVKRGGKIHPTFAWHLEKRLEEECATETPTGITMRKLWYLALSGKLKQGRGSIDLYKWIKYLRCMGLSASLRHALRSALTPYVSVKEPFRWPDFDGEEAEVVKDGDVSDPTVSNLVQWEIELGTDHAHHTLKRFADKEEWRAILPQLLPDFTHLLTETLDLMAELEEANERADSTYIHQPSISEHGQNRNFHDWTVLIELCRDAWIATAESSSNLAKLEAQRWFATPYPVFQRLAFFAATQKPKLISPNESLEWLLADNCWWLWSPHTQRETFGLIKILAGNLSAKKAVSLQHAILRGAPREMFKDDLEEERFQRTNDRHIWLLLAKFQTAGGQLFDQATIRFDELSVQYPWELAEDEQDEFPFWMGRGGEFRTFTSTPQKRRALATWLQEHPSVDDLKEADDWAERCKNDFPNSIAALLLLARQDVWPTGRWRRALQIWSSEEGDSRAWTLIVKALPLIPDQAFIEMCHPIAWWLQGALSWLSDAEAEQNRATIFELSWRLLRLHEEDDHQPDQEITGHAINHVVGQTIEGIFRLWFREKLEDNQLLRPEMAGILDYVFEPENKGSIYGRIIVAEKVIPLYRVDPDWTRQNLLPLFGWDEHPENALYMWRQFLYSPRIYWPLMEEWKQSFKGVAEHYGEFEETFQQQFTDILTYAALSPEATYGSDFFKSVIGLLPIAALTHIASTLFRAQQGAGKQKLEYFRNRIIRFYKRLWPKSEVARTLGVSKYFAKLCAVSGPAFPEALSLLQGWLQPIEDPDYTVHLFHEAKLSEEYPDQALSFLNIVTPDQVQYLPEELRTCLDAISREMPELADDPRYSRLDNILQQHGR